MDYVNDAIKEFVRMHQEYTEKTLAEIIAKYDFIASSEEVKLKLMSILPEGANVACMPECFISSRYITDPNIIYAIKKFDVNDLLDLNFKQFPDEYKEEK